MSDNHLTQNIELMGLRANSVYEYIKQTLTFYRYEHIH